MRAAVLTGFGGPERLEYRDDVAVPVPGGDEVLVQVGAAGVNNTDIWTREGGYGSPDDPGAVAGWRREPLRFPRIQGMDIAGRVTEAGDTRHQHLIGARVIVDPVVYNGGERGLANAELVGSERDGGFAEYVAVPAINVHPVDDDLSDVDLASFPTAYSTALRMLNRARVTAGETVLVSGASGGVGTGLVQLATARGARVIALAGPGKEDHLLALGAEVVVRRDATDLPLAVRNAAAGASIDVMADVVGGPALPALLDLVRPFGRYVTAGAIAGPMVRVDLRTVYLRQLELIGSTVATREEFADLVGIIGRGMIRPAVAETYPLSEIHRAQADFGSKKFTGKLVLIPSEQP